MSTSDPGLFGPDSVTWRVHSDPSMAVAGLRALLLQALHPRAMAGMAAYSDFREDPWGRLRRTAEYVATTTYSASDEAEAVAAHVRVVHHRLGLDQPDLQLWVHACLVDSFLGVAQRSGLGLTDDEADGYVREQVVSARLVGIDPSDAPRDQAELRAYLTAVRPILVATPEAREAARLVIRPPMPTAITWATPAVPAWLSLAGLAFAALPVWARRSFGLPATRLTEPATTAALRALRLTLLAVPAPLREGPHVRDARLRLAQTAA